jgi:hypothetical protein
MNDHDEHFPISRDAEKSLSRSSDPRLEWAHLRRFLDPFGHYKPRRAMAVSQPEDPAEVQADAIANSVMNDDVDTSQNLMQTPIADVSASAEEASLTAPSGFEEKLKMLKGSGAPLEEKQQEKLEKHLDADLDEVRVHSGAEAAELSASIQARAFSVGKDIFFKDDVSEELLAHEVVHTVQFDEESAMLSRVFDQKIYDERKPIYDKCMKEGSYLGGFTKKLVDLYGDPTYGLKQLQTNFFEKGTLFTATIDAFGHQYGLWPNMILIYYLLDETWTPQEGYPIVKSFVAPDGKFVILSTFKGQIYLQKDVKGGGSEPNDNATITAYNHIAVNGLKDKAAGGFYLYTDETLFNNAIALGDQLGFQLLEDRKDGKARKLGYQLKVSQFQSEYNILRANGYSKSIDQFLADPISLRDFLEGGKVFKNVSIAGIVKNEGGVNMRKTPFTTDDITRLGKSYEGPKDNFVENIPFNKPQNPQVSKNG